MERGITQERIIYANPCKSLSHIDYAKRRGVNLITFDNEAELFKMAVIHSKCDLVLRIETNDSCSKYRLSQKYGARLEKVYDLMCQALQLELNVVGISFHVGSDCFNPLTFSTAIGNSRKAFDIGLSLGFKMRLLDIGGGFPGSESQKSRELFDSFAAVINQSLDLWFPEKEIEIIAEPGRYFVTSACTLFALIIGKKIGFNKNGEKCIMYYINDGVYGSFSTTTFGQDEVTPLVWLSDSSSSDKQKLISMIWGPTCDSHDCIRQRILLPNLSINQWLMFTDMGAYTMSISTRFNGFKPPSFKVYMSAKSISRLESLLSEQ